MLGRSRGSEGRDRGCEGTVTGDFEALRGDASPALCTGLSLKFAGVYREEPCRVT